MRKLLPAFVVLMLAGARVSAQDTTVTTTTVELSDSTIWETQTTQTDDEEETHRDYLSPVQAEDRVPVAARTVPAARMDSLRRKKDFAYWKIKPEEEKQEDSGPSWLARLFASGLMRALFWLIIGIGLAALLYFFLLSLNINPFARAKREEAEEEAAQTEEDFFSRNYDAEAARALEAGDHRLAIRLRYLQLLRELADRRVIDYRQERPNGVYVSQLFGTPYYEPFFRVTRAFEYAWYGEMAVTRAAYDFVQHEIAHLKTRFS